MSPVIRVPDELFKKLEKLAVGFDTPASVIERLVNLHGGLDVSDDDWRQSKVDKKPQLVFYPSEEEFKMLLLEKKRAFVILHKAEGNPEFIEWNASKFSESSNLRGNLWSGFLRGWKEKRIVKAEFSVDRDILRR